MNRTTVKLLVIGFLVLLANSSYLAANADPTLFYFANVVLHLLLGLVLAIAYAGHVLRRLKQAPPVLLAGMVALGFSAGLGVFLMIFGATRPYRWALYAHIALAVAGSIPLLFYLLRLIRHQAELSQRSLVKAYAATVCLAVAFPMVSMAHNYYAGHARDKIANPDNAPLRMEGEGAGPNSPFFPSSANTNVNGIIPANFFLTSQSCGRCHKDIYEQWNSSAHHFSSFNNQWYRKSVEYMQDVIGTRPSKWCAGCHDHAVFFNGRFDRPIKEQINTPEAQAGLGCTSCHSIVHVNSTMGQGDFVIEYPPLHDVATSDNPFLKWTHDYLLKVDPRPHRETFLKRFHVQQTPEFCSSCHKVHLDVPVNGYRWIRGFNEYDNWQSSGVSGQGARSFYYPPKPQKCVDCHMPLVASNDPAARDGQVHSHRFPGANTALPYVNQDHEQMRITQDFLRNGAVSVDVFGLVRTGEPQNQLEKRQAGSEEPRLASTFAVGEESMSFGASPALISQPVEVIAPLDKVNATVRRTESVGIEVVVRTRKVGHFFPGGTVDAFDVWVELEAADNKGQKIFHSGMVEDNGKGPVEPGAHFYRSVMLDEHGNVINKRNAWMARSVAYVRLIPPGAADTIHYRLNIPDNCGDTITLKAKVNYRKFAWWNTQWAFAGIRDPEHKQYSVAHGHDDGRWVFTGDTSGVSGKTKAIPDIPITIMAEHQTSLKVIPRSAPLPDTKPFLDKSVRERWNDYGIGLLLQGDIRGAEAAFLKVTQIDPGYADGWVNVARARVQEGNMEAAEPMLRKALEVNPKLASAHFFLAAALKTLGRYDEALEHLRIVAAQYPRDRVVVNQIGRILFLKRQYNEAVAEFQKVLKIDPEDLQAHYNLMLCFQGLGNKEMAAGEQTLYKRFKADESAQFITGPYRKLHPDDNNERQQVHEHRSVSLAKLNRSFEYSVRRRKESRAVLAQGK
ncbi:MAG: tetratricopeptide repeat protein [Acidobacteria bacterium]|nr:tetratricopeptide repeat protein [Acidobacteriota bacterium]